MAVHQGPADGGVVHTDLYQPRRQPIPPHTGPAKRPRVGRQPGVDAVRDARVYRFPPRVEDLGNHRRGGIRRRVNEIRGAEQVVGGVMVDYQELPPGIS